MLLHGGKHTAKGTCKGPEAGVSWVTRGRQSDLKKAAWHAVWAESNSHQPSRVRAHGGEHGMWPCPWEASNFKDLMTVLAATS